MLEQGFRTGIWVPLLVRLPGHEPKPAGVLLVDSADDQLYLRLLKQLETSDTDLLMIWHELAADLQQMAQNMGGRGVLNWLDENASHVFSIGPSREIMMRSPDSVMNLLFQSHVARKWPNRTEVPTASRSLPSFSNADVIAARNKLPGAPTNALRTIAALRNTNVNFSRVEEIVQQDPTLATHLLKLANSAFFYAGGEIRTITQALLHVGLDRAVRHLSALVLRGFFSSPGLQKIWNHSIAAAQVNHKLASICHYPEPEELLLLGLIHDIGQIVLDSLGETFHQAYTQLRKQGHYAVEIERLLLGRSHAEIGAELLASWSFPKDIVEAVRYHHAPTQSELSLTSFVYVTESWLESDEDIFNPAEHQAALKLLNLHQEDLKGLASVPDSELALLRFVA